MLNTPYGTRGLARGKNFLPHNLHQKPGIPPQDRISCSALKKKGGGAGKEVTYHFAGNKSTVSPTSTVFVSYLTPCPTQTLSTLFGRHGLTAATNTPRRRTVLGVRGGRSVTMTRAAKPAVTAGLCASLLSVTVVFLLPHPAAACRGIALTGAATP